MHPILRPGLSLCGFLVLSLGVVILGVATLRAGVLFRRAAVLVIGGMVLNFVSGFFLGRLLPPPAGTLLGLLEFAWLGYALHTWERGAGGRVPSRR